MTDHEPAAGDGVGESGTECKACGKPEHCSLLLPKPPDKDNKHVVRIVGTYSLFTFFKEEGQRAFFEKVTDEQFENSLKHEARYARCIEPFHLDTDEKEFELQMTNMGFIREGFWKESFPPIFELDLGRTDLYGPAPSWLPMLPSDRQQGLLKLWPSSNADFQDDLAEAYFYAYSLRKLGGELEKVKHELGPDAELKFHIGLNKFGIVNIGLTIKWKYDETKHFDDLCRSAYTAVSHLQEDPLEDLKREADNLTAGDQKTLLQKVSNALDTRNCPRLVVSYFQVLAITTIHRFLYDKLEDNAIVGFQKNWLANPWELSIKIEESPRNGLPPQRHVVFMYQLVHSINEKSKFLEDNRRALLTLGHNVGWSPSWNPPFPLFDSRRARLKDSSLLETSCCLIFPQGLVVVIPPDPDPQNKKFQTVYPGGMESNTSSPWVFYRDYWRLIYKLFIRVAEARLLIGMVNRELSDIHKAFLNNRQARRFCYPFMVAIGWVKSFRWEFVACKTGKAKSQACRLSIRSIPGIHKRLMRVESIIQRTSGRVITPEVTRYSFVRKKLTDFLETVNFEEHRGYIQSEFEKLNQWVEAARTTWVARAAIVVAALSLFVTAVIGWIQISQNDSGKKPPACPIEKAPEWVKDISGEMGNLKESTAAVNFEMQQLQAKIAPLAKDLEALKRCQHPNPKNKTSGK